MSTLWQQVGPSSLLRVSVKGKRLLVGLKIISNYSFQK
jgi:hypothetical protein